MPHNFKEKFIKSMITYVLQYYAKKGIYIDIGWDGYKLDMKPCARSFINYYKNGSWIQEDCGCFLYWTGAFKKARERAKFLEEELN